MFSVPVPAEQNGVSKSIQRFIPTNSQVAESSALTAMKTEPEMPIPIISQTGMKSIEHTVNDQRPRKDYL